MKKLLNNNQYGRPLVLVLLTIVITFAWAATIEGTNTGCAPGASIPQHTPRWFVQYNTITHQYRIANYRWDEQYDYPDFHYCLTLASVDTFVQQALKADELIQQRYTISNSWKNIEYPDSGHTISGVLQQPQKPTTWDSNRWEILYNTETRQFSYQRRATGAYAGHWDEVPIEKQRIFSSLQDVEQFLEEQTRLQQAADSSMAHADRVFSSWKVVLYPDGLQK